jgi:hypothetical protein
MILRGKTPVVAPQRYFTGRMFCLRRHPLLRNNVNNLRILGESTGSAEPPPFAKGGRDLARFPFLPSSAEEGAVRRRRVILLKLLTLFCERGQELNVPGGLGVRVDSAVYQGYNIPPYCDSMISKLIVFGNDRDEAIARMRRALAEYLFEGIITNVDYQIELLSTEEFQSGDYNINFIDEYNKRRGE